MDEAATRKVPRPRAPRLLAATVTILMTSPMSGCSWGGDDDDNDNEGARPAPAESTTSTTSSPVSSEPSCEDGTLDDRHFILCVVGDRPDQGLIVALHGRGSSAQEMQAVTELDRDAAVQGRAVVFPDSLDGGWGDDTFTTSSRPNGDEDVAFLDELIVALRSDPRIDDQPVGLVGFSNGASMALRYAAQRPDNVHAVVSVAGQLPRDPSVRPSRPVSLLQIYGTGDPLRGYDTGIPDNPARQPAQPTPTVSTPDTVAAFVAAAGDTDHEGPTETDPDPADETRLRTERWTDGEAIVVVLRTIVNGGHTWPSGHAPQAANYGPISGDVDASAEAVAFILDPSGQL